MNNTSNKEEIMFRLGELFCGPGGLALGAIRTRIKHNGKIYGIEHTWANDYDLDTCKTYIHNICGGNESTVFCRDVRKLDITSLKKIDCFAYGFPCNDFSVVGERKGVNGTFGPLYLYGINVLNIFKPKYFIAENVKGITSANEGSAFLKILDDLSKAGNGYNLTTHLYKFEEYGVPQTRHRIIIVGIDKTLNKVFRIPIPITPKYQISVRKTLEEPPIRSSFCNHEFTSQSNTVIERLKYIKPGENAWTAELPDHLKLNVKKTRMSHIYRRLHPDKPSYTITGSGGGGTHTYHWKENRALTNRERARIQTFPDDFIFKGSKESVRKQIGMAVPPKMSQVIFESALKTILGIDYQNISTNWNNQHSLFK